MQNNQQPEGVKVGDTVYIRYIGTNPLSHDRSLKPVKVIKVTKQSFSVEPDYRPRLFKFSTMKHKGGYNEETYRAYLSQEDYHSEQQCLANIEFIKNRLSGITFEQSQQIIKILQS